MSAQPDWMPGRGLALTYVLGQQALWVLVVWGAAAGHPYWPSAVAAAAIAFACWRSGTAWWRVMTVVLVGVVCGAAVDGSLGKTGLVIYVAGDPALPVPPVWILALWACFAATLALPARSMISSPVIAALLGGLGGPLAYAGGRALGALDAQTFGLVMVGVFYALATPVIVLAANRLLPLPAAQRSRRP
ncbi:MAG TPA: hypothetical protein DCS97_10650 [Planctomycetes bacterium]|nr:hypothetical protein [Planctomycetota bacterium]